MTRRSVGNVLVLTLAVTLSVMGIAMAWSRDADAQEINPYADDNGPIPLPPARVPPQPTYSPPPFVPAPYPPCGAPCSSSCCFYPPVYLPRRPVRVVYTRPMPPPVPVYVPPPQMVVAAPRPLERVRHASFGLRALALWIDQSIDGDKMLMGGAGLGWRFRNRGRFGVEIEHAFLHASLLNGNLQRDSFPTTIGLMFYLLPNRGVHVVNLYGIIGGGGMVDVVHLYDPAREQVSQTFWEWVGQAGLGLELRWGAVALSTDLRAMGFVRDSRSDPGKLYGEVVGAPVLKSSWGLNGNINLNFWF